MLLGLSGQHMSMQLAHILVLSARRSPKEESSQCLGETREGSLEPSVVGPVKGGSDLNRGQKRRDLAGEISGHSELALWGIGFTGCFQ